MSPAAKPDAGVTIEEAIQIAVGHHQAGRLGEAEGIYRQVLQQHPEHPEALHLLGLVCCQSGRNDAGVELIGCAVALRPNCAEYRNNHGLALSRSGRAEEALAAYHRALALQPAYPEAHNNLGNGLADLGRIADAIAEYRRAIQCRPDYPQAHFNLGNALSTQGCIEEAVAAYERALVLQPDYAAALTNLGNALSLLSRTGEAVVAFQRAILLTPDLAEAHNNLGNALVSRGRFAEAQSAFQRALELRPDFSRTLFNLGSMFMAEGRVEEAIAVYRRVGAQDPHFAEGHSTLLFSLHYVSGLASEEIAHEGTRWNQQHAAPVPKPAGVPTNIPDPERSLRIGFVSADFRDHVVGRAFLPCLEVHDRSRSEWFCYSGCPPVDRIGERIRELATGWCAAVALSDEALAARIRKDRIDILVDLSLHTAGNRLLVFAHRPAPVQVSWLGYPGSTGLEAIGYWVGDPHLECSPDEGSLRLPDCWSCYAGPTESPTVTDLPALHGGGITFGSFNNLAKINAQVLALWSRLLREVKGSRLRLLARGSFAERTRRLFEEQGIAAERIEFLDYYPARASGSGESQSLAYLDRYQRIDIALDPFPYNGMTTTCDALWMGVPVVALIGRTPMSRASFSLLSNVGLAELAASSESDYIRIATELAGDLPRLVTLRATLRERMLASPLLDAPRLTRNLEELFRSAWRRWCESARE